MVEEISPKNPASIAKNTPNLNGVMHSKAAAIPSAIERIPIVFNFFSKIILFEFYFVKLRL